MKPTIIFDDEEFVAVVIHESRLKLEIDWKERQIILSKLLMRRES